MLMISQKERIFLNIRPSPSALDPPSLYAPDAEGVDDLKDRYKKASDSYNVHKSWGGGLAGEEKS